MISNHFSDDRRVGKILYAERVSSRLRAARHEAERIPYFLRMPTASLKNNHVLIPIVSHLPLR